jgi:hypothetical protein
MPRLISTKLKADVRRLVKALDDLRETDPGAARTVERLLRDGFARRRKRTPRKRDES